MKDYSDPREQSVSAPEQPEPPDWLPVEPLHICALKGQLERDTCINCGLQTKLHFDTSGCNYIGCDGARCRIEMGLLENRPTVTSAALDAHRQVARVIEKALLVDGGVVLSETYRALGSSQQAVIASRLAQHVMKVLQDEAAS